MNDTTPAIKVEHVSKRFCRSLKHSMIYGMQEIAQAVTIPGHFRSPHLAARISDWEKESTRVSRAGIVEGSSKSSCILPRLRRHEFWALRDVSFDVPKGERVGLVGKNGAGKSTLFSILSGIYAPTAGRTVTRGRLQALIALGAGFNPSMSGRENIYINGAILGMGAKEIGRKIEDIIDFSEIQDSIDAPVKTYSSGMLVRLGFAIASQMSPDILLLDEVLSVGDSSFQAKSLRRAAELTQSGCTVVLVSHNLLKIKAFCERCLWLHEGQVRADGPAPSVLLEYDTFLARELGRSSAGNVACLRRGTGLVSVESYELADHLGQKLAVSQGGDLPEVTMGQDLQVRFCYIVKDGNCGHLRFVVGIKEPALDVKVVSASSDCLSLIHAKGYRGKVEVVFPRIPLREGEYSLYLGITDDRLNYSEAHAVVDEISPSFRVVPSLAVFENVRGSVRDSLVQLPYEFVHLS